MTDANVPRPLAVPKSLETLAFALDGLFRIPGTQWRVGLDGLIGLIPGVGDALTAVASYALLFAALRYRVPKVVILRMALNLGIDYLVGVVPVVGDLFDLAWKANQKNLELLRQHGREGQPAGASDWLLVGGVVGGLVALLIGSVAAAVSLLAWLLSAITG